MLEVWESGNQDEQYVSLWQKHEESLQSVPERRGGTIFFTRGSSSPNAHADFLRRSEREREKERTGSKRGRKSGVMPNFLTFSERERKVIEPTERIIKRPLRTISRECYQSRAAGVFFMVQKSCCFFEVSSKFHCDTRGHSEVVNERVTQWNSLEVSGSPTNL